MLSCKNYSNKDISILLGCYSFQIFVSKLQEAVFTNDESLENHVPEESPADCDPLAAKTFADVGVNTKPIVPTRKDLKRKIKTLRQKLRRQDVTINRLKEEVKRMRKESENSDTYYS